jgi:hypothetical protein
MKLLVTCDQVFDCLTRGPFPSGGREDEAVQWHLEACHECRQLAEALRPAVALLHEALPVGEQADLPTYGAAQEDEDLCERADGALAARIRMIMDRGETRPRSITSQEKWLYAVRFLAASVLALALGTLLAGVFWQNKQGEVGQLKIAPVLGSEHHQPNAEGLVRLAALNLPRVCLPGMPAAMGSGVVSGQETVPVDDSSARPSGGTTHACCTRCHAAGKEGAALTQRTIAALQQSCILCHQASL